MNKSTPNIKIGILPVFFVLISIFTVNAKNVNNTFNTPDFAFPKTVEANARAMLDKALNTGDNVKALKAAMQIAVAENLVSNENYTDELKLFGELSEKLPAPYARLAILLQAQIYSDIYNQSAWTFNSRTLPIEPMPENVMEWSRDMFAVRVRQLVAKAMEGEQIAKDLPIAVIKGILKDYAVAESAKMTVYDFMTVKSCGLVKSFKNDNEAEIIPFGFGDAGNKSIERDASSLWDALIDSNIAWHEKRGEMQAAALMSYYKYSGMAWNKKGEYADECMKKYIGTPYCAPFLLSATDKPKQYRIIKDYLERFPDCGNAEALRSRLSSLGEKRIEYANIGRVYPGVEARAKVSARGEYDFNILLVKLPDSYLDRYVKFDKVVAAGSIVASVPVKMTGEIPDLVSDTITLPPLKSGVYVALPSHDKGFSGLITGINNSKKLETFNVSRLAAFRYSENKVYVVDGMTQQPVAGASVVFAKRNSRDVKKRLTTDSDGSVAIPNGNYDISISKGDDRLNGNVWMNGYAANSGSESLRGRILTDLSIYRPGDELRFVGFLFSEKNRVMRYENGRAVKVSLLDANYQPVDTLLLATDRFGRVEGKFKIPESGLLGNYNVRMTNPYNTRMEYGSESVEVADYKSPTFFVTTDGTEESYKIGDVVRIKGSAKTYSGTPVAGADVKFDVRFVTLPWLDSNLNASYGGSATTASDGSFTIELPTEGLRGTKYSFGGFRLCISVTSPSGETREASSVYFSLGSAYNISPILPERIEVKARDKAQYPVKVFDIVGNPVSKTVFYKVTDAVGKECQSGSFESPMFSFDASPLPSGKYKILFSLDSEFRMIDNQRNVTDEVTIYRLNDKMPPYKTALWTPENRIVVRNSGNDKSKSPVKVRFGTSYPDSWIFMSVADCDSIIERRWVKVSEGMTDVEVKAPSVNSRVYVTLSGMRNFEGNTETITLIPECQVEKVRISAESFRDRITPGANESWKFKFTLADEALSGIPVSAVMSNKALNAIAPFRWMFDPAGNIGYGSCSYLQWIGDSGDGDWRLSLSKVSYSGLKDLYFPQWNLYKYSLYGASRVYASVRYSTSDNRSVAAGSSYDGEEGAVVMNEYVVDEMKMASPMMAKAESAEEMAVEVTEDAGSVPQRPDTELREIECPSAFFMPMLMTDANGEALVNFTVPQFNGTWQFQIMGYTENMKGAAGVWDAVASKPVMVQMNAPRFVRTDDKVTVAAMLYNNDDKALALSGIIEIFNPETGGILKRYESEAKETAPSGCERVAVEYTIPSEINCIGIRVYAKGGDFTDGEQTIVPVYPSSTPVLESETFYLAPGQQEYSMKVPSSRKGAKVTLQYCDNPIWEVVTALPEISEPESGNVLSQVYSLYGNAIGAGLAKDYPEIVKAIEIFANPVNSPDSTLVSNLEKNQDLKNVLLNNTPWVRSAASETMRMQSLVKYGDAKRSEAIIAANLKDIVKLQNPDGGWSWCSGMESSEFITARVLLHLGMLENMGYLPEEGEKMAMKAIAYADAEWVKDLKSYKGEKYPYSSMSDYLYVRSNFRNAPKSKAFAEMAEKCLKEVKGNWKNTGIYDKATTATLLSREGYPMEARTILESLRQFASVSPRKGMWFDNLSSSFRGWNKLITTTQVLEAYAEIEPQSPDIDLLRQWLLITKQTENWGDDRETAEVIHAILSSGTKWTAPTDSPKVFLNGEEVEIPRIAALAGNFTMEIPAAKKGELRIVRNGAGPAWGGLISQYVAPIEDVKSAKVAELSIEKNLYVITNDADGTTAKSSSVNVGDKVRATLTLVCDRDLEYVAVMDARAACLEPAEQLSGYSVSDGVWMYKEVRDNSTNLFIPFLPKGTHVISYDCYADRSGEYSLGIASAQSQYAPAIAAHSTGKIIVVK